MSISDLRQFVKNDGLLRPCPSYAEVCLAGPNFDRLSKIGADLMPPEAKSEYEREVNSLRAELVALSGDKDSGKYCELYVETHRRARKDLLRLICSLSAVEEQKM